MCHEKHSDFPLVRSLSTGVEACGVSCERASREREKGGMGKGAGQGSREQGKGAGEQGKGAGSRAREQGSKGSNLPGVAGSLRRADDSHCLPT